jgi:hypothetical protein
VLGLLAVQPWTAYELTQQMRRSLHYLWPKSESLLYTEPKKLVDAGLAGGPYPERLHLIALLVGFYGELFDLMRRFFDDAADLVGTWHATTGVPADANLRGRLERTLRLIGSPGSPE